MDYGSSYRTSRSFKKTVNWWLIIIYLLLIFAGWANIYSSVHVEEPSSIFDWSCRSGKQFVWMLTALGLAALILFAIPPRVYEPISPFLYGITVVLLIAVIFVGSDIKGSHSWFSLGPVRFQPAEISKIATSLLLATIMSRNGFHLHGRSFWTVALIIALPMLIIIAEKETGSALVYAGFVFVLYREGLSGWIISLCGLIILLFILTLVASPFYSILVLLCIASFLDCMFDGKIWWWCAIAIPIAVGSCFIEERHQLSVVLFETAVYAGWSVWNAVKRLRQNFRWMMLTVIIGGILLVFSTDFIFDNVLKDYQRGRIEVLLGIKEDLSGAGYNVHQSKIAIGSGGMWGKGYLNGTQTAFGFVPEQSTDFIFCTVGEEWGFVGSLVIILLYVMLIYEIIKDSERSRGAFTRIYGYCLASCLFMHLTINVGMTLALMPVIGIPLPFMSYGGSSLWAFTVMLFIFIALDINERKYF